MILNNNQFIGASFAAGGAGALAGGTLAHFGVKLWNASLGKVFFQITPERAPYVRNTAAIAGAILGVMLVSNRQTHALTRHFAKTQSNLQGYQDIIKEQSGMILQRDKHIENLLDKCTDWTVKFSDLSSLQSTVMKNINSLKQKIQDSIKLAEKPENICLDVLRELSNITTEFNTSKNDIVSYTYYPEKTHGWEF